jgi:hypothetical protein
MCRVGAIFERSRTARLQKGHGSTPTIRTAACIEGLHPVVPDLWPLTAHLARCGAFRRSSPFRTHSGHSALSAGALHAPHPTFAPARSVGGTGCRKRSVIEFRCRGNPQGRKITSNEPGIRRMSGKDAAPEPNRSAERRIGLGRRKCRAIVICLPPLWEC